MTGSTAPAAGSAGEGGASSGGAGGAAGSATGGSSASGGAAGSGGGAACLPEASYASLFTLEAKDLCAVAMYTADATINFQQPTWGSHGGPLLVEQGPGDGQVTLLRYKPPSGAEGKITIEQTVVDAKIPVGAFAGAEALDLGFRPGTAISYSGAFPDTSGELIVVGGASPDERYPVNGLFSMAVLAAPMKARLVYSGLSPLGDKAAGANGLYAADDCSGTFVPMGMPACKAPIQVAAWGDASGPVAADSQGNVIAVMTSFAGDQVGRAFAASAIAAGAGPVAGDELFKLDGFGQSLAAIAPSAAGSGIAAFQPSDAMTFKPLDVLQIRYAVGAGKVTPDGQPSPLLTMATPDTPVAMLTDPQDRLWVGVPSGNGTAFLVLMRKP